MLEKINPNHLTTFRALSTIPILWLISHNTAVSLMICILVLAAAEITDFLDGWLARKYDKVTTFGKFYDPLCDIILHMSIFICLINFGLSFWIVAIFAAREFVVNFIRINLALTGIELGARKGGKLKTVFFIIAQFVFIVYLLSGASLGSSNIVTLVIWYGGVWVSMSLAVIFMLYSLYDYLLYFNFESHR